jgi:hypothetical protein
MLTERRSLVSSAVDDDAVRCTECHREVDEFTAIAERSRYWSDGCGELLPFCPESSKRQFAPDAPASVASPPAPSPGASSPGS